jgi:heat shock protein HtpX
MLDSVLSFIPLLLTLFGAFIIDPLTYWMIDKGKGVYRSLRLATVTAAILMLPGVIVTTLLILSVLLILIVLGGAGIWGVAILLGLFLAQYLVAPYVALWGAKARKPEPNELWLQSLLEEVKQSSGYRGKVELLIADNDIPNAFAIGNAFKKFIVLHKGLINILDRDEIKAVIAHELGHIAHNDNTYAYAAALTPYLTYILGVIVLVFGIGFIKSKDLRLLLGGIVLSIMGVAVILVSIVANLGLLAFSRVREHLADIYSVRVTGDTKILDALRKIEVAVKKEEASQEVVTPSLRSMLYIVPALYPASPHTSSYLMLSNPFSTHPKLETRELVVLKYYQELTTPLPPPPPPPP